MKIITLNESQYKRLFEIDSFVRSGGEENQTPISDFHTKDEITTTAKINGKDGNVKDSLPPGGIGTNDPRQQVPGDTLYTIHGRGFK